MKDKRSSNKWRKKKKKDHLNTKIWNNIIIKRLILMERKLLLIKMIDLEMDIINQYYIPSADMEQYSVCIYFKYRIKFAYIINFFLIINLFVKYKFILLA